MTRQSRFWKPIHFYLVEKVLSIIDFKRLHVTKTQGLRRVDPFWDPFQQGVLLAKSRDRNHGVILLAGTRTGSRPNIVGAGCVPQLPPLRIYVNTTYQRYILLGIGHSTRAFCWMRTLCGSQRGWGEHLRIKQWCLDFVVVVFNVDINCNFS